MDGSGGSAPIPVRVDGEPEPDLVIPVLPRHSRIAERVLHWNLSDAAARALLATVGAVLRYGFAVHSYAGHVYRRRIAGAVRVGQLRIVAGRGGADVHLCVSADRESDLRAEDLPAHHGCKRCRGVSRGAGVHFTVRCAWSIPRIAGGRVRADDLPHLYKAVRAGRFPVDGRSGA